MRRFSLAEASLLDQTVLVAMSDMGDPAKHSSRQIPALLAGGWGGALRGGRHIDLGTAGTPSNRLLVSIQQVFGVANATYGQSVDATILGGALDLLTRGVGPRVRDVVVDRGREQERVVRDERDCVAEAVQID